MSRLVDFLSKASGLSETDVERIIRRAPYTYKSFTIPKRDGISFRVIAQPAREVKLLQRLLMGRLSGLPVHSCAMAYRKGISIRDNADSHIKNGPILKYDFKNFFTSIRALDWIAYASKREIFSDKPDYEKSAELFFVKVPHKGLRLAIGAPSSPWLSNILMCDFDRRVEAAVSRDHVTYTRYADDLTFSAPRVGHLRDVDKTLRSIIRTLSSPRLLLNENKTVLATPRYRRVVTGLVLADDKTVSLGREKKREIRARVHHGLNGKLSTSEVASLIGLLSYVRGIEPDFYERLCSRYASDIQSALRINSVPTI